MHATSTTSVDSTIDAAWKTLLNAARYARRQPNPDAGSHTLDDSAQLRVRSDSVSEQLLWWQRDSGWSPSPQVSGRVRDLFDLYLPVCNSRFSHPLTIGHLGQSLDGYIATEEGDSFYVTGPENILHLHRMRALCDAVVVGAETVSSDNPRLTTRLVPGNSPIRVVLDPRGRLSPSHAVFTDTSAPTLIVLDEGANPRSRLSFGQAEILRIPFRAGQLDLAALLSTLHKRAIYSVFVEGGGTTVSRFLEQHLLNRLQIAIAPLIIGSGRPGVRFANDTPLRDRLRPHNRLYRMGADILFDLDLSQVNGARLVDDDDDFERIT